MTYTEKKTVGTARQSRKGKREERSKHYCKKTEDINVRQR